MYVWWKEKKTIFFLYKEKKKDFSLKINVQKDWLRYHTSWTPCGIEMKIKGILNSWFWISLHQGYMLSFMNEVDPWLLLSLCVLYVIQNQIFQQMVSKRSSISFLYNMWSSFRIKEKPFSWCFYFLQ